MLLLQPAGSPKAVVQRVQSRTVKCEEPAVYRNKPGSLEELRLSVDQYVLEVPADTAERVDASFLERVHEMSLERSGACTSRTCANKRVTHSPFFK